ncbi:DUF6647 family protein [Marinobacter arenosus]|uniref:DUF6647 family protein n=1 Tax=Marinobacter arenosus TaxID=2856822 RepID=UPI001C4D5039|nr:DUF6647 family protein [Marinobacter arenosus]MBW0148028.1 hypothetical protein [Marinobacter arenosus]
MQSVATTRPAFNVWVFLLWLLAVPAVLSADAALDDSGAAELSRVAVTLGDWIIGQTRFSETELPGIQFKTQAELAELCFPGFSHDRLPSIRGAYDARAAVVYLNTDFQSGDLLDTSYLLHELVHHFQVNDPSRDVRVSKPAMEAEALRIQMKWLEENGVTDAMRQLGVDEKTLRMLEASPR